MPVTINQCTIYCSAHFCDVGMDIAGEWIQLDIPDQIFEAFCSLKCLHKWIEREIDPNIRTIESKFWEPIIKGRNDD